MFFAASRQKDCRFYEDEQQQDDGTRGNTAFRQHLGRSISDHLPSGKCQMDALHHIVQRV